MLSDTVKKRSIALFGKRTSISLEDTFWQGLGDAARANGKTPSEYIETIDKARMKPNLSSCIRVTVLEHFQTLAKAHELVAAIAPVIGCGASNSSDEVMEETETPTIAGVSQLNAALSRFAGPDGLLTDIQAEA